MQLLTSPTSPFVRKVRVMIREADLLDRVQEVMVTTTPYDSAAPVLAANPLGKIPVLLRPDAPAIYDGRNVTRYLDDLAGAGLYPATRLWDVLTLEATADAMMEVGVAISYETRFRTTEQQSSDWMDIQWGKAANAIAAINNRWISHLTGPLHMGQIAVACALAYVDFRHDSRDWRSGNDALARWHADFMQRDTMQQTQPI